MSGDEGAGEGRRKPGACRPRLDPLALSARSFCLVGAHLAPSSGQSWQVSQMGLMEGSQCIWYQGRRIATLTSRRAPCSVKHSQPLPPQHLAQVHRHTHT